MSRLFWIFFAVALHLPAVAGADGIKFLGQGDDTSWQINDMSLSADILVDQSQDSLLIERDGIIRCEIHEGSFRYFPVSLTYQVENSFAASNRSLVGQDITLRMVFSRRADTETIVRLPNSDTPEFGLRRSQYEALDRLSTDHERTASEYVPGFIMAMFAVKYYDVLLEQAPEAERNLIERRRLYFAKLAANFLFQQHVQDRSTGEYALDPIILPDGDAYDLLLSVLRYNGEVARRTVLGTRYRSFWSLRDRIETMAANNRELPDDLLQAARSISNCLLADNGLASVDGVIVDFLKQQEFYVPNGKDEILTAPDDGSFNMWRALYIEQFGEIPSNLTGDEALVRLFEQGG
ncbi:hypothetical protein QTO30_20075 [Yoonia sp. GPGPB17]|uniref:hypothetical protein n=1 Tax=Yoonia sp. GPGPB17 TaxID=3026147 RepID=UPI0030BD2D2D